MTKEEKQRIVNNIILKRIEAKTKIMVRNINHFYIKAKETKTLKKIYLIYLYIVI